MNVARVAIGITTSAAFNNPLASWFRPRNKQIPPTSTRIRVVDTWPVSVWRSSGRRPNAIYTPPPSAGSR